MRIANYVNRKLYGYTPIEFKKILDDLGMKMPSGHTSLNASHWDATKKEFTLLARELMPKENPAIFNQAIMEFGALQCKPKSPLCAVCPLQKSCFAYLNNKVDVLPIKLKKVKVRERYFNYFLALDDDFILTKQRVAGDVWQQMYDLPLIETDEIAALTDLSFIKLVKDMFGNDIVIKPLSTKKHLLTHQIIYVQFFALDNYIVNFNQHTEIKSVTIEEFKALPHPKVISDFIDTYL